ncbi:carbohydrate ABC transporter permease [Microlunatus soli]|uniref:Carbohydrate ABC transporter membrane protein 2, CUT1 family n=1 Tax=Microlunatus soli TaxID=630515 RepID=A0A1H1XTV3_9ACTN|nr:carbohydrate ABC transporter permease [Microlunatus soli]SDT12633.1 carbohydrate ABC transporter membrane protein 2, CUT1 family [Microlunatus soli]
MVDQLVRPEAVVRAHPTTPSRSRRRARLRAVGQHSGLIIFALIMIYPLLWMLVSSFKPDNQILADPSPIPREFTLENFIQGWNVLGQPFIVFFINSLIVTVGAILGNLFSCSLTAYALARLEFRMRKIYVGIVLVTVMLPIHVLVIPQYIFFSQLHLVNTYFPLVVPKVLGTDSFFVFLMIQFIRGIPRELDQAAMIDGSGPFRTFLYVILPLMRPALLTTTIFTFIWTWNDFFVPLIYLTSSQSFTVPVALNSMVDSQSQGGTGMLLAMSVVSLVPIMLFFVFAQRHLIRGIATTGLK